MRSLFSCFWDKKRKIVTLCFHFAPFSFKNTLLQTHEKPCYAPCLDWYPKSDQFCDSTVGPGTLFGPPPWLGWMVTTYPSYDGHVMSLPMVQGAIWGHSMVVPTTCCVICHPVSWWFHPRKHGFSCFYGILFFRFFSKNVIFAKTTFFGFLGKRRNSTIAD